MGQPNKSADKVLETLGAIHTLWVMFFSWKDAKYILIILFSTAFMLQIPFSYIWDRIDQHRDELHLAEYRYDKAIVQLNSTKRLLEECSLRKSIEREVCIEAFSQASTNMRDMDGEILVKSIITESFIEDKDPKAIVALIDNRIEHLNLDLKLIKQNDPGIKLPLITSVMQSMYYFGSILLLLGIYCILQLRKYQSMGKTHSPQPSQEETT